MSSIRVGNSSLILHCGGYEVSDAEMRASVTPEATATHFPVAHSMVVDSVTDTLSDLGWTVQTSAHALMSGGMKYFGLLQISKTGKPFIETDDMSWVIGLRNAHDQVFKAAGMLGNCMTVCDNLCFSGRSKSVFEFARKHTKFISRDFAGLVSKAFGNLQLAMQTEEDRIAAYKNFMLPSGREGELVVHDFLVRALQRKALTGQMLPRVLSEWTRKDGCGGLDEAAAARGDIAYTQPTAWKLLNTFTEVEKQAGTPLATPARNARLTGMLDGLCGLSLEDVIDVEAVEV